MIGSAAKILPSRAERTIHLIPPMPRLSDFSLCFRFLSVELGVNLWLLFNLSAPVAQLDRATASGAVGCAFEPRRAHF
jgi:hypothetical protein